MIGVILLTIVIIGALMLLMAVGLFGSKRQCLKGSCGGLATLESAGGDVACETCPYRPSQRDPSDPPLQEVRGSDNVQHVHVRRR